MMLTFMFALFSGLGRVLVEFVLSLLGLGVVACLGLILLAGCSAKVDGWGMTIKTPLPELTVVAEVNKFDGKLAPVWNGDELILFDIEFTGNGK